MFCRSCGGECPSTANFCYHCGQKINLSQVSNKAAISVDKKKLLRGSVPKNGPIDFASKNHFSLNSADGKGLVPKY